MICVNSITINADNKRMTVGESQFIYATVCPANATKKCVTWSSNDSHVATVNEVSGLVMAHSAGTAIIQATAQDGSGVVGTWNLTVMDPISVEDITLSRSQLILYKGNTHKLTATVCPANATIKTVRWHSSKPSVASVNSSTGIVSAKAAGSANIYAEAQDGSGVRSCCTVVVKPLYALLRKPLSARLKAAPSPTLLTFIPVLICLVTRLCHYLAVRV